MKYIKSLFIFLFITTLLACNGLQSQNSAGKLDAPSFEKKIQETPDAQVVDVRTPEEFANGHLANALNIDWNGDQFEQQSAQLDKSKPVLVYCMGGGRSAQAAARLSANGFKNVYDLKGGIMSWRSAGKPEIKGKVSAGMNMDQFREKIDKEKITLVDFYAEWCAPCRKMKPYMDEIAKDMTDKVNVVRINVDEHQQLCKELKIEGLPVIQIYSSAKLRSTHTGFASKEDLLKMIQ